MTDEDQTAPLCSKINCTYYSLGANEKIASSLYVFCAPILLSIIAVIAQRVIARVSTVRIPPLMSGSHYSQVLAHSHKDAANDVLELWLRLVVPFR